MNKWIKIGFSGATLHYKQCGVTTGRLLVEDSRFDTVHHFDIGQGKMVSEDRIKLCPETILSDEFRLIDGNGCDVTDEARKEASKFGKFVTDHPDVRYVYMPINYGSIFQPFNINQIVNMFAVFIGEKPVSTYHPKIIFENGKLSYEKINQNLIDIVNNGFIKLDTPFYYENPRNSKREVIYTLAQLASGYPSNSKRKHIILWWENVKANCKTDEEYNTFIQTLENISSESNIEKKYNSLTEFIRKVIKDKGLNFVQEELKKINKLGILPENCLTFIRPQRNRISVLTECKYIGKTIQLSGSFIFKVPEDVYEKLLLGSKTARYLENGFAILTKWDDCYGIDEEYFEDADFGDYYHISDVVSGKTDIGKIKLNNKNNNNDTEDLL